ncbi:hypothetical protein Dimus_002779 [Dionaea muscipula]
MAASLRRRSGRRVRARQRTAACGGAQRSAQQRSIAQERRPPSSRGSNAQQRSNLATSRAVPKAFGDWQDCAEVAGSVSLGAPYGGEGGAAPATPTSIDDFDDSSPENVLRHRWVQSSSIPLVPVEFRGIDFIVDLGN